MTTTDYEHMSRTAPEVSVGDRTVSLGDPEGAAMYLASTLAEDPAYDTEQGRAIRMLLAERDDWYDQIVHVEAEREPVTFDAALSPCLGDLLRKSLTNDQVSPQRKAMITAVALLGAARVAAGHPQPSKAWANSCYLAMDPLYTAMNAWADAEGDRR